MRRFTLLAIGVCVLVVASTGGVALAQDAPLFVRGEPDLDAYAPEPELSPGTTHQVSLQVANGGEATGDLTRREMVTTARNVEVRVSDDAPFNIQTQRQSIGTLVDGQMREVPITVTVPADVEPGTYRVEVQFRYRYTALHAPRSGVGQERSRTTTETVRLRVSDQPRFELQGTGGDAQIGTSGTVQVNLTNTGSEPARAVDVGLETTSPYVSFADAGGDTARIERLAPGESIDVDYEVLLSEDAPARAFSLEGAIQFIDPDGVRGTQTGLSAGFSPLEEQRFTVAIEESTLRVGEPGIVRGQVTNDGPVPADDVTVELGEGQFEPRSRSYAVGDLDVGESADIQFRAIVPREADAVPQRVDMTTRYRTSAGVDRTSTDPVRIPVAERRDAISVSSVEPQFAAGESGVLTLELQNQRDTELSDIRVTLEVIDPLDSDFRSTVVPSLDPGQTDRVSFDLEVDSDAPASQYPATVSVEYLDADDEEASVRPATVAVEVTGTGEEFPVGLDALIFVVLSVLVVAAFVWLYRR